MKVFLSWSGPRSKSIAELLYSWLPQVIQAVDPWISSEMEKGQKWSPEISHRLSETRFGLLCLTRENLSAPWLLFEAGALSKTPDAYVWTFLHGISPVDVEQPLAQFQHTVSEKNDVRKLMHTINQAVREQNEKSLAEAALNKAFEAFWPELEQALADLAYREPQIASIVRTDRDLLEELLELVRAQEHRPQKLISSSPLSSAEAWPLERQPDFLKRVLSVSIVLDVPEANAKSFVDALKARLPHADYHVTLTPDAERVAGILIRFPQMQITTEETLWGTLSKASQTAGLTILHWWTEAPEM